MTDQLRINPDDPRGPLTWDGEPIYCAETVKEARAAGVPLFDPAAFQQLRGQMAIGQCCSCGGPVFDPFDADCSHHRELA